MASDFSELATILVCPATKSKLLLDESALICCDPDCRLRFAIEDGIPIMLVDEAEVLPVDDWQAILKKHDQEPAPGAI